jgi:hypothetical protein
MYLRYYWAFFVKHLMSNEHGASPSPSDINVNEIEDVRLGAILADAINCQYQNADEIIGDVKLAALAAGVRVIGEDEVEIDEDREHVFEVRGRDLHFRAR